MLIPGDFYSNRELDPAVSRESIAELRRQHGLDLPVHWQYLRWLRRAAHLDLGYSLQFQAPVASVVAPAVVHTLWLGTPTLALGLLLGILIGSLHALAARGSTGALIDLLSTIALSLPPLVLGLCALSFAAHTGWFPLGGTRSPGLSAGGPMSALLDRLHHLVLPASCMLVPLIAYVGRIQFAAAQGCVRSQSVVAAVARGVSRPRVFCNHLVRPSLNPVLSVSGPLIGAVLGGSLVLEVLFAWPGLGQITYDALFSRDLYLLVGCVTAGSLLLIVGNLLADALLFLLDPRTRASLEGTS